MSPPPPVRSPLPVLAGAVLVVLTSQQAMVPVLAPLARDLGLPEYALGLLMTGSAGMFALTSPRWGRAIDSWGHRRVLVSGLWLCLAGVTGFAICCELAVRGVLDPVPALTVMIVTRALLFGVGMGAVPVAASAWIAANTVSVEERIRGLSRIGAVNGLAMALGPALGALLAFAGFLGPVWLAPGLIAVTLVAAMSALPRAPRLAQETSVDSEDAGGPAHAVGGIPGAPVTPIVAQAARLRPWDARLWPVMVVGLSAFLAMGVLTVCLGFLVQDRLEVTGAVTVRTTGLISTVVGIFLVATQALVVPRLGWSPWQLLRAGVPLLAISAFALIFAHDQLTMTACMAGVAVGLGLAGPGYTAAPTLLVGPAEQGQVAGLVQSVTGLTFVFGPLAGTTLYGIDQVLPMVLVGSVCTLATVFVWVRRDRVVEETVTVG